MISFWPPWHLVVNNSSTSHSAEEGDSLSLKLSRYLYFHGCVKRTVLLIWLYHPDEPIWKFTCVACLNLGLKWNGILLCVPQVHCACSVQTRQGSSESSLYFPFPKILDVSPLNFFRWRNMSLFHVWTTMQHFLFCLFEFQRLKCKRQVLPQYIIINFMGPLFTFSNNHWILLKNQLLL